MNRQQRVMGIDSGFATVGWSIVEKAGIVKSSSKYKIFGYGIIRTEAVTPMPERLNQIYISIKELIKKYKPDSVAIESLFYFKNQKTVITVSQARGVAILAAIHQKLSVFDYTPLQVKQSVTGYGKATKNQVQQMVKSILGFRECPKPDDAADALAIALCHLNTRRNCL
jgi:crossover junction endodeoxyribonuclease RuvC